MPELPEVETMRRGILPAVGGRIILVETCRCRRRPITIAPSLAIVRRRLVGRVGPGARLGGRSIVPGVHFGRSGPARHFASGARLLLRLPAAKLLHELAEEILHADKSTMSPRLRRSGGPAACDRRWPMRRRTRRRRRQGAERLRPHQPLDGTDEPLEGDLRELVGADARRAGRLSPRPHLSAGRSPIIQL